MTSECRSPRDSGKKQWKWKLTGTLFYFCDRAGRRLTPHGYDMVGRTEQGLIYGIILAKDQYDPATYEAVSPTGKVTPIRAVTTGYPPSGRLYYRYRRKRD